MAGSILSWRRRLVRVGGVVTDSLPEVPGVDETDRAVESWLVAEALSRLSASHREMLAECFASGR